MRKEEHDAISLTGADVLGGEIPVLTTSHTKESGPNPLLFLLAHVIGARLEPTVTVSLGLRQPAVHDRSRPFPRRCAFIPPPSPPYYLESLFPHPVRVSDESMVDDV